MTGRVSSPRWAGCPRGDSIALFAITLVTVGANILAYASDDVPVLDDWTYAWSVRHFLTTGQLRMLEWSAHYPLTQLVWAAPFADLLGFSFSSLRVSTLVLEWVGLLAFYVTLRQLGIDALRSVIGVLALLFNPVFFVLGHSFMLDVPFTSLMNVAVCFYVLWIARGRSLYLGLGGVFASLAFLTRQIGAALPLVPIVCLILGRLSRKKDPAWRWREIPFLVFPFLVIAATLWWIRNIHGATEISQVRSGIYYAHYVSSGLARARVFTAEFWSLATLGVAPLVHLGLILSPLTIPGLANRSRRSLLGALFVLTVLLALHFGYVARLPLAISPDGILTWEELGATRAQVSGWTPRAIPWWAGTAIQAVALTSAFGILALFWTRIAQPARWITGPAAVLALNAAMQFFIVVLLWFFFDRYYLPFLPALLALLVADLKRKRAAIAIAMLGVLTLGVVSISGTIDSFRFTRAVSEARQWLLDRGIPPWQIDAGYVLNGWWLYAHPENLPPGARPESDVAFVTSPHALPYTIAGAPKPSYTVLKTVPVRSIWAVSDRVYVLRKNDIAPSLNATVTAAPGGSAPGTAHVSWSTGDGAVGQVYVVENDGEEGLFAQGVAGGREASWIRHGVRYEFRLYAGIEHRTVLARATLDPDRGSAADGATSR